MPKRLSGRYRDPVRIGWAVLLAGCAQASAVPIGFFTPDGRCLHRGGSLPDLPKTCVLEDGVVQVGAEPWMVAGAPDLEIDLDGPGQLLDPVALRCCGVNGCLTSTTACALEEAQLPSFRWRAVEAGAVELVARQQGDVVFEGLVPVDRAADYQLEVYTSGFFGGHRADPSGLEVGAYSIEVRSVGTRGGFIRDDRSPHRLTVLEPEVAGFCYVVFPLWFLSSVDERATALNLCARSAGATSLVLEKAGQVRTLPIRFTAAHTP